MAKFYVLVMFSMVLVPLQAMKHPTKEERRTIEVAPLPELLSTIKAPTITQSAGTVKLVSSEGQPFEIARSAAELSLTLKDLLEEQASGLHAQDPEIPVNIDTKQLSLIIKSLTAIASITT